MERMEHGLRFAVLPLCLVALTVLFPAATPAAGGGEVLVLTVRGPISPPRR